MILLMVVATFWSADFITYKIHGKLVSNPVKLSPIANSGRGSSPTITVAEKCIVNWNLRMVVFLYPEQFQVRVLVNFTNFLWNKEIGFICGNLILHVGRRRGEASNTCKRGGQTRHQEKKKKKKRADTRAWAKCSFWKFMYQYFIWKQNLTSFVERLWCTISVMGRCPISKWMLPKLGL